LTARIAPEYHEIHLWRAEIDAAPAVLEVLAQPLSVNERERARRFRAESDRTRFTCARGWLRQLLAGYVDVDPADLTFIDGGRGKPRLDRPNVPWLSFNVSHSAGVAVYAIARGRAVGVDIEEVRQDFPVDAVARRFFAAPDHRALAALPADDRINAFFAMWSQKEAYLKGMGVGLGEIDRAIAATPDYRKPIDDGESADWSLASFDAGPGFAAAVAVEGTEVRIPALAQLLTLTRA
jgi:4'-phosphopantetheinyl transferase